MATELNVPVRLQVLLDSISDFLKVLNNLLPNTASWKTLSKLIGSMTSEAQKLAALLSTPFSSEKLFTLTSKTIDKLEEAAARVSIAMQGIKFSEIKLTPAQTAELEKFDREINTIRESYKQLLDEVKQRLINHGNNANLIGGIDKGLLEKEFDDIEAAVDEHVIDLDNKVQLQQKAFEKLRSNIELGMKATALTTSGKGLTREALGDTIFDKFLSQTENGLKLKFHTGITKLALLEELEKMFNLTPGDLQYLSNKTINLINEAFLNMGKKGGGINLFSGIINRGNDSAKKIPLKNEELDTLKLLLEEYKRLLEELDTLRKNKIDPTNTINTTKITEILDKMQELRNTILAGVGVNDTYKNSMSNMSSAFPELRSILLATNAEFLKMQRIQNTFNSLKTTVANFMGFTLVLNLTKRAIKEAANHIKELDTVMNKISIVTSMDTSDLWGQIESYSKMAQSYGTSIKGAYEVSLIYYQQGLDTADVLNLTNETLKLAKISGLDYAATTDYMTTALRGFKMEMSEAATVVDVYSNLAAHTAVTLEELAVAMSKTASSLESVGSTFEEASAMIATMVTVTRESATNIGSAMKSIAARYGEMKSNPLAMADSEGEAMSFNKVDTALQSVGISMKTAEGQFREFTDVIIELGEKWNLLESTLQRYIATLFAGNRQQSRFLALISNVDLLKSNLNYAETSEDTGTVLALKALDSLESKIELVRVAYLQFYTTIGAESVWKGFLDITKNVINTLNGMPKLFGKIPLGAINAAAAVISVIKSLGQALLSEVATILTPAMKAMAEGLHGATPEMESAADTWIDRLNARVRSKLGAVRETGVEVGKQMQLGFTDGMANDASEASFDDWFKRMSRGGTTMSPNETYKVAREMEATGILGKGDFDVLVAGGLPALDLINRIRDSLYATGNAAESSAGKFGVWASAHILAGKNLLSFGTALNMISLAFNNTTRGGKALTGTLLSLGGMAMTAGALIQAAGDATKSIPWTAIASGIIAVINGISQIILANSIEAKLEEFTALAEELNNKAKELKVNYKTLQSSVDKYHELEKARYDSAEAAEEYLEAVDKLAEAYPSLILSYTETGEIILDAAAMENALTSAREASADATLKAALAEAKRAKVLVEKDRKDFYTSNDELQKILNTWNRGGVYNNKNGERVSYADAGDTRFTTNPDTGKAYDIEILEILAEMHLAAEEQNTDRVFSANEQLNAILGKAGWSLAEPIQVEVDKILETANLIRSDSKIIESANLATVSAYVNKNYGKSGSAFEGNSSLLSLATTEINSRMLEAGIEEYNDSAIYTYANEVLGSLSNVWDTLTDNLLSAINEILDNADHYTKDDLAEVANDYGIEVSDWLYGIFTNKTVANKKVLLNKIDLMQKNNQLDHTTAEKINETIDTGEMNLDQRKFMSAGLNLILSLNKNGLSSDTFLDNFLKVYSSMAEIPAAARNALIDQFTQNGFTKEGLQKTLKYIEDNNITDVNTDALENIIESTILNITLAIDASMSNLTENLDDIDSVVSTLLSGVKGAKLEKTIGEARKLGIDISRDDFKQDGDKFILDSKKLEELINKVYDSYKDLFKNSSSDLEKIKNRLTKDYSDIDAARGILGGDFEKYYAFDKIDNEWFLKSEYDYGGDLNEEFTNAIENGYKSANTALKGYFSYLDSIKAELLKTTAWKAGNYESLTTLNLHSGSYTNADTAYKRIQYLAANPFEMTKEEYELPDVTNAVETYRKGISLMLDDLSKYGAEYVKNNAFKYEGLDENKLQAEISSIDTTGGLTLTEAIKQYASQALKTIAETNQLLIDSWTLNLLLGAQQDVAGLVSGGGFSMADLSSYLTKYKKGEEQDITQYIDNGLIVNEALAAVYELDETTGKFKLTEAATLTDILTAWSNALGITITEGSELYNQVVKQWATDKIAEADKNDAGKLASNILSLIISGKVGARIDTSASAEIEKILGTEASHVYEIASEFERDSMILALNANTIDDTEWRATVLEALKNIKSKRSQYSGFKGILSKSFDINTADTFLNSVNVDTTGFEDEDYAREMRARGYDWDSYTRTFRANSHALIQALAKLKQAIDNGESSEVIAELAEMVNNLETDLNKDPLEEALMNLVSGYSNVSDDVISKLNAQFTANNLDINVNDYIKKQDDGSKKLDVEEFIKVIPEQYRALFNDIIAQVKDNYIANIEKASSLVSSGTTSVADMDTFTESYNEIMGLTGDAAKSSANLFNYNDVLKAWTLDPSILLDYVLKLAEKLVELGQLNEKDVDKWVSELTSKTLAANVNIGDFLSADNRGVGSDAYKVLKELIILYQRNIGKTKAEAEKLAVDDINALNEGGNAAVRVVLKWARSSGKEATSEEIQSAFENAINLLNDAMDLLADITVGLMVTGKLKSYLQRTGKADANGVVTSVSDMVDVYQAIYDDMEKTAGKTTAGLNEAYAKVLTAGDQKDIDTLEALENASGMTYDALGNILSKYNINLKEFMANSANNGIEKAGFGKVKITDWDAFASSVGLSNIDMGTPEYMEAYNSWVDSRTQFENKEKERIQSAVDELNGLTEATPESAINVSHLESVMGESLSTIVLKYGATLNLGMLKLGATTNIPALILDIANEAARTGKMIPELLAELADAVLGMLQLITSLILNGIKGSLNNSDVTKLLNWATLSGLGKLDFLKTADGLKLSEKSAILLYNKLKEVDGLLAKLVFDDLRESLEATNDNFKDTESLLNHVKKIREGTYKADDTISKARKELYQAELEIAEEILKVRSTQEDDSYNFMDKKIPAGLNNPLNYMLSWAKAYEAMKATGSGGKGQKGMMLYQDFYNIITEMGHIAELSGEGIKLGKETLENSLLAADLITKAAGALQVTADGSMKVDLSKIGVDFVTGANEMNKNVDKGIDAVAQSLIDMLDSLIKMLEVIVAMEKLGDVDIDKSGSLELGEIFELDINGDPIPNIDGLDQYTEKFKEGAAKILEFAEEEGNEELKLALLDIRINGYTLEQMFQDAADGVKNLNLSAEAYTAAMNALYQASLSDDYDLDNIADTLYKILEQSGLTNAEIDVGDITYYIRCGATSKIDFSNKEAIEAALQGIDAWIKEHQDKFSGDWLESEPSILQKISQINQLLAGENLSVEERADLEMYLKIAEGTIKIVDTGETDKNGKIYEGTYHGLSIKGTRKEVEDAILRAIDIEEGGFEFKFNEDGSIYGRMNLGNATIELNLSADGETEYIATSPSQGSKSFGTRDEALGWLASQGFGTQGTYEYDGGTFDVFVDTKTGISYSIDAQTGEFICDNNHFATYAQLQEYLAFRELGSGGKRTYDSDTNIETIVKGDTTVTYDHTTREVTYNWTDPDGNSYEFPNKETYEAYIAAWEKSGGNINADGDISYNVEGATVSVNYNPKTGELTYTAHLANGKDVIAHDEDSLMFGIAAETLPKGGEVTADDTKTYSYTVKAGNVSVDVSVDENGTVTTTGDGVNNLSQSIEDEVKTNAESKIALDQIALDTPANVTLDTVNVTLDTGAVVNVDSVGALIVEALQTYLNNNPVTPTVGAGTPDGTDNNFNMPDFSTAINLVLTIADTLSGLSTELLNTAKTIIEEVNTKNIESVKNSTNDIKSGPAETVKKEINGIVPTNASLAKTYINTIDPSKALTARTALNNIKVSVTGSTASAGLTVKVHAKKAADAKGNIGAFAKGNIALANGTLTLVGELGPELVVSDGQYYVVGLNGAEFVNLKKDAIVFNHKLTERLLTLGGIGSRGVPFTNELNAISYAKGNVTGPAKANDDFTYSVDGAYWNSTSTDTLSIKIATAKVSAAAKGTMGPAMASASAALAALKLLRAMWQSLQAATAQDLASLGGSGGGGGGNGGQRNAAFLQELEKWYNWLLEIARLEQIITLEEAKRKRIQSLFNKSGKDYFLSLHDSLDALTKEVATLRDLAASQKEYLEGRKKVLLDTNKNPFASLYTMDNNGTIKYATGKLKELSEMSGTDEYGKPNKTAEELYNYIIKELGINSKYLEYDASGNKIEDNDYAAKVQAFWDKMQADQDEILSLNDSIAETELKIEELDTQRNELLQEMRDNLLAVEQDVLKAVESQHKREIDNLQDLREALEKSSLAHILGLTDALNKELEMYNKNQSAEELNKLQRLLEILKRSGGSGSLIRDLQSLIEAKQREEYFAELQRLIDAIQEASDKELERLDTLIELLTEILEYQKEMGLLWNEVYAVMNGSAESIVNFITNNDESWWAKSPVLTLKDLEDAFFNAQYWTEYRDKLNAIAEHTDPAMAEGTGTDTAGTSDGNATAASGAGAEGSADDDDEPTLPSNPVGGQEEYKDKYSVTWTDKNGKKKRQYFDTKQEAEEFAKKKNKKGYKYKGKAVKASHATWYVWAKENGLTVEPPWGPYTKKLANSKIKKLQKNKKYTNIIKDNSTKRPEGYITGGYNYETGLAMLHGTSNKPEAVLNATQTQILRDNILSNKPDSLISLLKSYNDAYRDGVSTINNDAGIVIENATVNMNVQQIANDYDAQRAGEQALEKMLLIARKTSAKNSIRR